MDHSVLKRSLCAQRQQHLVSLFATAIEIARVLAEAETYGPDTYRQFEKPWGLLRGVLNELCEEIPALPESVQERVEAIVAIVNQAAIGPGYRDVCRSWAESGLKQHREAGWKAVLTETKAPAVGWAPKASLERLSVAGQNGRM